MPMVHRVEPAVPASGDGRELFEFERSLARRMLNGNPRFREAWLAKYGSEGLTIVAAGRGDLSLAAAIALVGALIAAAAKAHGLIGIIGIVIFFSAIPPYLLGVKRLLKGNRMRKSQSNP